MQSAAVPQIFPLAVEGQISLGGFCARLMCLQGKSWRTQTRASAWPLEAYGSTLLSRAQIARVAVHVHTNLSDWLRIVLAGVIFEPIVHAFKKCLCTLLGQ